MKSPNDGRRYEKWFWDMYIPKQLGDIIWGYIYPQMIASNGFAMVLSSVIGYQEHNKVVRKSKLRKGIWCDLTIFTFWPLTLNKTPLHNLDFLRLPCAHSWYPIEPKTIAKPFKAIIWWPNGIFTRLLVRNMMNYSFSIGGLFYNN